MRDGICLESTASSTIAQLGNKQDFDFTNFQIQITPIGPANIKVLKILMFDLNRGHEGGFESLNPPFHAFSRIWFQSISAPLSR